MVFRAVIVLGLFGCNQTGASGVPGADGSNGAQGPAGPTGAAGSDGQLRIYGDASGSDLTVTSTATLDTLVPDGNYQFGDVTIASGVTLYVDSGVIIRCTGTFTNNGLVYVSAAAENGSAGISRGPALLGTTGPASVAGGPGGYPVVSVASVLRTNLGGGAGATIGGGADGGGSLVVLARTAIVNANEIFADGTDGFRGGGGAGGVIILASPGSIANTGTVSAVGGAGGAATTVANTLYAAGGGGGGGIIRYISPAITDTGTDNVAGGGFGASDTTPTTAATRIGGGGGGGCGGGGGDGSSVSTTNFEDGALAGYIGKVMKTKTDPTSLF